MPAAIVDKPRLPAVPSDIRAGCPDIEISRDALIALVEHRKALAECRRLQADSVAFYDDVKTGLEAPTGEETE